MPVVTETCAFTELSTASCLLACTLGWIGTGLVVVAGGTASTVSKVNEAGTWRQCLDIWFQQATAGPPLLRRCPHGGGQEVETAGGSVQQCSNKLRCARRRVTAASLRGSTFNDRQPLS